MTVLLTDGPWLANALWWSNALEVPERFARKVDEIAAQVGAVPPFTVAWDCGSTWRHDILPSFKSHRPPKPQALKDALRACQELPGLRHVSAPGFDSDDILGTLGQRGGSGPAFLLAVDKDFCQIVSQRVRLVNAKGEITTEADVERKWGVPPSLFRAYLSWCGDSSDGLPGVRGVGPKRAVAHALAGEIGDPMTFELVGLATVPGL